MIARSKFALYALVCAFCLAWPIATAAKDVAVSFAVKDAKVCRGQSTIRIEVELRNRGKQSVAVDFSEVGFMYSYYPPPRPKAGQTGVDLAFMDSKVVADNPVYVVVAAGGSEKREVEIRLPPRVPYDTAYLDLRIYLKAEPSAAEYQGLKTSKGELHSKTNRFRFHECEESGK